MYESLFGSANVGKDLMFDTKYEGTLDDVLKELSGPLSGKEQALHPPRILRALMDYKINDGSFEAEAVMPHAVDSVLEMYRNPENSLEEVKKLKGLINVAGIQDILIRPLNQMPDPVTSMAQKAEYSQHTANQLGFQFPDDILFIALGHGGVAAGMDVYLRYCDATRAENSEFYPVRFSTQKVGDATPRLTQTEIDKLQRLAMDKTVIIFDEDRCSGKTLRLAESYFTRMFEGARVAVYANLDHMGLATEFGKRIEFADMLKNSIGHDELLHFTNELIRKKLYSSKNEINPLKVINANNSSFNPAPDILKNNI